MDKIAIFISGRLTCYETNLIPALIILSRNYDVHLFISINGERDEYHITAERLLGKWLKDIRYEKFKCPIENNINIESLQQEVDGKKMPYTVMSCFYNDMKAFELIEKYESANNMNFRLYCKLRPDMIFYQLPQFHFVLPDPNDNKLYSCVPECPIWFYGWQKTPICISDAFAYGNKKIMQLYCNAYNFGIEMNDKLNGDYRFNYETLITENMLGSYLIDKEKYKTEEDIINAFVNNKRKIQINYFQCPYNLNKNRRNRDTIKHT